MNIDSMIDSDYTSSIDARLDSPQAYINYQMHEARRALVFLSQFIDVQNARVLEVGVGRGGKSIAYALAGMHVTALDVDIDSLQIGSRTAQEQNANVQFLVGDGECLPFPNEHFDAILLDSVIEHVHNPGLVLQECNRILSNQGIVFVVFPPFYGPLSGHIDDYVLIPWFHVLPRAIVKKYLLSIKRNIGILTARDAYDVYATLNHLTIFQFKNAARRAGFDFRYFRVRPFLTHPGMRFAAGLFSVMRHPPRLKNLRAVFVRAFREFDPGTFLLFILLSVISPVVFVPVLQEIAAGGCKVVLSKSK